MSIELKPEYGVVRQIASVCRALDPEWSASLLPDEQDKAIRECAGRIEKLTKATLICGALVLEHVNLRNEGKDKGSPSKVCFTSDCHLTSSIDDAIIHPLSQKEASFYLLYGAKIIRVRMSSKEKSIVKLHRSKDTLMWDVSSQQIEEMMKKNWDHSFVTAYYCWDLVVPIPGNRGEEEKE